MRKLGARPDTEFCVDAGERPLNRPLREMKCCCHFLVRPSFRDQFGNALFGASESTSRRRAAADPPELDAGAFGPERRAQFLEDSKPSFERSPCGASLARLPLRQA
jgi:hypothetical protein